MLSLNYSRLSKYKLVLPIISAVTVLTVLTTPAFAENGRDNEHRGEGKNESREDRDGRKDWGGRDEHGKEDKKGDKDHRNKRCKNNSEHKEKCDVKEVPEFGTITSLLTASISSGGLFFLKKRPF